MSLRYDFLYEKTERHVLCGKELCDEVFYSQICFLWHLWSLLFCLERALLK